MGLGLRLERDVGAKARHLGFRWPFKTQGALKPLVVELG